MKYYKQNAKHGSAIDISGTLEEFNNIINQEENTINQEISSLQQSSQEIKQISSEKKDNSIEESNQFVVFLIKKFFNTQEGKEILTKTLEKIITNNPEIILKMFDSSELSNSLDKKINSSLKEILKQILLNTN